ncbi:hypothetical protein D3C80_1589990 [compost metagenome]
MFHLHRVADEASQAGYFEHLVEVQGLTLVDEIQGAVSLEYVAAVAHGSQVGGGVQIATVGFLHDYRQWLALGGLEFVEEHALGALAFNQQTFGLEVIDDIFEVIVIGAFAHDVGHGQFDVQQFVGFLAV